MSDGNNGTRSRTPSVLFLCLVMFVIYNSNFRWFENSDSVPNSLLPFRFLTKGDFYLDGWIEPYWQEGSGEVYYVVRARGHWMSTYPVLVPLVISPLYVLPVWWMNHQEPPIPTSSFVSYTIVHTMEKISASLFAALTVGVLYLALGKVATRAARLTVALVCGLASNTWTISSQSLWRQGFTELSFALLLWALLRGPSPFRAGRSREAQGPEPSVSGRSRTFCVGLALALAAANKPAYALLALVFLVYFARSERKGLWLYCLPLAAVGLVVVGYNYYFFGRLLGAYPDPLASGGGAGGAWRHWWGGMAGLLVSPNRGLFIYMPWTLLAVWGAAQAWRENTHGWERYLIGGLVPVFFMHAKLGNWWAGMCYGPRYLTDLLPILAFFLVPLWPRFERAPLLRAGFVLAVAASLWIQVIGAYYYPRGRWDWLPANVNLNPQRVWDWSDNQIMRSWRSGPAEPQLLDDWWTLLKTGRM